MSCVTSRRMTTVSIRDHVCIFGRKDFASALGKDGAWGSVVVKALLYKSEGPGIDSER